MLYCVRCGDPIEKDELICDKCGLHFTVIDGDVANPTQVYMQKVPGRAPSTAPTQGRNVPPIQAQSQVRNAMPMQPQGQARNVPPMQQAPIQGRNVPPMQPQAQTRSVPPQGQMRNVPSMQQAPMQGGNIPPMQPQGQTGNVPPQGQMRNVPPMRPVAVRRAAQPKAKKKKNGWLIALYSVMGVFGMACLCSFVFVIVFFFTGGLMIGDDGGEPIVVNTPDEVISTEAPVVYQSVAENTNVSEVVEDSIRSQYVTLNGDGTDKVTVMIYMNGSNLESDSGMASQDIREILNATLSDNINVIIQTCGTKKWQTSAISSKKTQRFLVQNGQLTLIDDSLGQLDCTAPETLRDFIMFSNANFPANRNILILWDHGGGAVYGFGYDELVDDYDAALTLDEIQTAIGQSGVKFEMIGFDACLMGGLETACALYDCADYLIASEDFESGYGWEYQNWLTCLGMNSSMPMEEVGKVIVDDFVKESQMASTEGILSLIDLRYSKLLFSAWIGFADASQEDLLACNYNMEMQRSDRAPRYFETRAEAMLRDPWEAMFSGNDYDLQEYSYAVDLMALASTLDTEESRALSSALSYAMVYCSATSGDSAMTGLSVTLPYEDYSFYQQMEGVFSSCGFDQNYVDFLERFANADATDNYNWDDSDWEGWESYEEEDYDWESWDQWYDYQFNDYGWEETVE